jgi:type I site-specific restriction endonuclease
MKSRRAIGARAAKHCGRIQTTVATLRAWRSGPLETDTCRDYVLPRLKAAGWSDDQIQPEFPITDGRIISIESTHRRGHALRADYMLEHQPGLPIVVVGAERDYAIL